MTFTLNHPFLRRELASVELSGHTEAEIRSGQFNISSLVSLKSSESVLRTDSGLSNFYATAIENLAGVLVDICLKLHQQIEATGSNGSVRVFAFMLAKQFKCSTLLDQRL